MNNKSCSMSAVSHFVESGCGGDGKAAMLKGDDAKTPRWVDGFRDLTAGHFAQLSRSFPGLFSIVCARPYLAAHALTVRLHR